MLLPKRVKYRKQFRGRMTGKATRGNKVNYGEFGLQVSGARLDYQQPDRGSPCCHDPLHQAWRSGLDQDLPRQACTPRSPLRPEWVQVRAHVE